MINEETRRKLRLMNMGELIEELEIQDKDPQSIALNFDNRLQMAVDGAYQRKYNDKVRRLIKTAKLRFPRADVHDLYYEGRPINRNVIEHLATCRYVEDSDSVVIQGYTSSGKTFLGCALAKEACRHLYKTRYIRVPDLLMEFADKSILPGGKEKVLNKYTGFKVLVLDEWLINDISSEEREFLFELSERRFDSTSTIFCTLYRNEEWLRRLGGGSQAESIVERYRHISTVVETGETNMREIFSKHRNTKQMG